MIKFLKNQDIQVTTFAIAKNKTANSIFSDLILASDGTFDFPLLLSIEDCDYNFTSLKTGSFVTIPTSCNGNVISQNSFLACSPITDENNPHMQFGLKMPTGSVFYPIGTPEYNPTTNPMNKDGTYQGQVYNTVKNMYYNNYNNAYEIFGFDGFNTSQAKLNLDTKFVSYTLNVTQSGDRIRPKSIIINNQTGDIVAQIRDDGLNNLYLSGSYFVNDYEVYTNNTNNVINYGEYGLGRYLYNGEIST